MSWRVLISALTLLQQLTMCFAFSCSPALLHQHFFSDLFFEINSLLFPTQRRFSWISRITFRDLG